jgi:hypothetical protein
MKMNGNETGLPTDPPPYPPGPQDEIQIPTIKEKYTMMRKQWALGFLGLLGIYGITGLVHGDWLQSVWIAWFAFFSWFIPAKKV